MLVMHVSGFNPCALRAVLISNPAVYARVAFLVYVLGTLFNFVL